jgi:hypothetical protein
VPKERISQRKVLSVEAEEQRQVNAVHNAALLLLQLQEQPKVPQAIARHCCCCCCGNAAHAAW